MKRIFTVLVVGLVSAWSIGAHAQLGGLGALKGGKAETKDSGAEDLGAKADKFVLEAALIREAVARALTQINLALGDKEQIAAAKKTAESLGATTNPKEAAAKQGTAIKDMGATAELIFKNSETEAKIKNLKPELQKKVAESLLMVGIASLRLPKVLDEGKGILQGLSGNMMANMSRITPLKDGLSILGETAPKLPPLVSAGFNMMKTAKVNAPSPTEGAELKKIAFVVPDEG